MADPPTDSPTSNGDTTDKSSPSTLPPDASISTADSLAYWTGVPATTAGMLGGFPHVSRVDLIGSSTFLAKLRRSSSTAQPLLARVVDCGAGIGRVTLGLLAPLARTIDAVEPVPHFASQMRHGDAFAALREAGQLGEVIESGLESWVPRAGRRYDLVWNQWCLGHLTDAQLVAYLRRVAGAEALAPGGWVVIKENLSSEKDGADVFDATDSSVTRSDRKFRELFARAGLRVVATELQRGFPRELYKVRMYALQPEG